MAGQDRTARYHWLIVQDGQLGLLPDGSLNRAAEHRCTVTLVWPEGKRPTPAHTLLVDPCFTDAGYAQAQARLAERGMALDDVGRMFVTHLHGDHMLHFPYSIDPPKLRPFRPGAASDPLAGVALEALPGHHPLLLAPAFLDSAGRRVWIVSDAVLGEAWLRAWRYYWPNGYAAPEIVATWRSVARVLASADVIVTGHAAPIQVSADLLAALVESFPRAEHAAACPDVGETLHARLAELRAVHA